MFNGIKADLYRIITGRLVVKVSIFMVLLSGIQIYQAKWGKLTQVIQEQVMTGNQFFPLFFIPLFLVLWSGEFSQRTVNQSLIFGLGRGQFLFSKFMTASLGMLFFLFLYYGTTLLGCLFRQQVFPWKILLQQLAPQLPIYLAILALGFCLFSLAEQPFLPLVLYVLLVLIGESILGSLIYTYYPQRLEQWQMSFLFSNLDQVLQLKQLSSAMILRIYGSSAFMLAFFLSVTTFMFTRKELK